MTTQLTSSEIRVCPVCGKWHKAPKVRKMRTCSQACRKALTIKIKAEEDAYWKSIRQKKTGRKCQSCGEDTGYNYFFCPSCHAHKRDPYIDVVGIP